jgi:LPS sulfotransferase NodH
VMRFEHLILTTPRSGSNYLCTLLVRDLEIDISQETFNPDFKQFKKYLDDSDNGSSISNFLETSFPEDKLIVPKILFSQLNYIRQFSDFSDIFRRKIIYLRRNDVISQSISLYIAFQTSKWTSKAASTGSSHAENDCDFALKYDFSEIANLINRINYFNSSILYLLSTYCSDFISVSYEDILSDEFYTLDNISEFLSVKRRDGLSDNTSHCIKQGGDINRQFHERFISDQREHISDFDFVCRAFPPRGRGEFTGSDG